MSDPDLGALYGVVRERLSDLAADVADPDHIEVPACPGWSVHDVVAHVVGIAEDVVAGRLSGPPDDEWTANQVAERRDKSMAELLTDWAKAGPRFQELISRGRMWPGFLDALSHEHDVRGAVAAPAGRDAREVLVAAEFLVSRWRPAVPVRVRMGEREFTVGPDDGAALGLVTSPFEAFRFRMGRRSRSQLAAMAWSGDPTPVLDRLTIFGPSGADIHE